MNIEMVRWKVLPLKERGLPLSPTPFSPAKRETSAFEPLRQPVVKLPDHCTKLKSLHDSRTSLTVTEGQKKAPWSTCIKI
jgi:hypothetical protein